MDFTNSAMEPTELFCRILLCFKNDFIYIDDSTFDILKRMSVKPEYNKLFAKVEFESTGGTVRSISIEKAIDEMTGLLIERDVVEPHKYEINRHTMQNYVDSFKSGFIDRKKLSEIAEEIEKRSFTKLQTKIMKEETKKREEEVLNKVANKNPNPIAPIQMEEAMGHSPSRHILVEEQDFPVVRKKTS